MNDRLRRAGVIALVVVFALYAFAPLLRAGFVGTDLAVVTQLGERVRAGIWPTAPEDLYTLEGAAGRPAAALWLLIPRTPKMPLRFRQTPPRQLFNLVFRKRATKLTSLRFLT